LRAHIKNTVNRFILGSNQTGVALKRIASAQLVLRVQRKDKKNEDPPSEIIVRQ